MGNGDPRLDESLPSENGEDESLSYEPMTTEEMDLLADEADEIISQGEKYWSQ